MFGLLTSDRRYDCSHQNPFLLWLQRLQGSGRDPPPHLNGPTFTTWTTKPSAATPRNSTLPWVKDQLGGWERGGGLGVKKKGGKCVKIREEGVTARIWKNSEKKPWKNRPKKRLGIYKRRRGIFGIYSHLKVSWYVGWLHLRQHSPGATEGSREGNMEIELLNTNAFLWALLGTSWRRWINSVSFSFKKWVQSDEKQSRCSLQQITADFISLYLHYFCSNLQHIGSSLFCIYTAWLLFLISFLCCDGRSPTVTVDKIRRAVEQHLYEDTKTNRKRHTEKQRW